MKASRPPKVSIGLPVYNGENFLEQAIESLRAQTYTDFELILSDNDSTDRTVEICRAYARRNPRVWYTRAEKNMGAAWNFNRVVELTSGQYFKWAAHDDLLDPTFLERCVSTLEANPDAVLAYPLTAVIDPNGKIIERLALLGRFVEIPETLSYARRHPLQSIDLFGVFADGHNNYHLYMLWFDPSQMGRISLPTWQILAVHAKTLASRMSSLSQESAAPN